MEPSTSGHCTSRWKLGKAVGDSDRAAPQQLRRQGGLPARQRPGRRRQRRPASMNGRPGAGSSKALRGRAPAGRPAGQARLSAFQKQRNGPKPLSFLNCNCTGDALQATSFKKIQKMSVNLRTFSEILKRRRRNTRAETAGGPLGCGGDHGLVPDRTAGGQHRVRAVLQAAQLFAAGLLFL